MPASGESAAGLRRVRKLLIISSMIVSVFFKHNYSIVTLIGARGRVRPRAAAGVPYRVMMKPG